MTDLTTWKGCTVTPYFAEALADLDAGTPGIPLEGIKGGWQASSDSTSAATHLRDAIDIGGAALTPAQRLTVQTEAEKRGIVFWIRGPAQGFAWHLHGLPNKGDVAPEANAQLDDYYNHKNGLIGHAPYDRPSNYDYVDVTWASYKANHGAASSIPSALTGGFLMALSDAEQAEVLATVRQLQNVALTGRVDGDRSAWPYAYTPVAAILSESQAADAAAAQHLGEIENLLLTGHTDKGLGSDAWPYPFTILSAILGAAQQNATPAQVAAAIPADMAKAVADELAKRLNN